MSSAFYIGFANIRIEILSLASKVSAANTTLFRGQHIAATYGLRTPDPYACGTSDLLQTSTNGIFVRAEQRRNYVITDIDRSVISRSDSRFF